MLQKLPKPGRTAMLAIIAAGALLMLSARLINAGTRESEVPPAPQNVYAHSTAQAPDESRDLETRLAYFFSLVEGAGSVQVMVGFSTVRETAFAVDSTVNESATREEDAQGGTREVSQLNQSHQTVLVGSAPLIVRESIPAVEGIVIIAQGGGDPIVRTELTRAAQAILGIDAHRIQVLAKRSS